MPRFPRVSPTTESLSSGVFSELVKRAKARGGVVHPLHVGDTYLEPLDVARAEAQRTETTPRLHNYAPVQGEPTLLDAIAEKLEARVHRPIARESLQVMAGATSGLAVVANALLDAGDEVLLPSPFWPLIRGIFRSRGAVPVEVPLFDRLDEPGFDVEAELEARVTERTTAIYVNTPNNPTSRILGESAVDAIARVARRHDLWVLADEAYEELWFGEERPAPVWDREDLRDRTIASHTLSKGYGLAGARIGFTHGPLEAMRAIQAVQTFTTYCAPRPMQLGAARALREGDAWVANARTLYREAGNLAADALGVARPEGGTFLFIDARPFFREGEDVMGFLGRCLDAGVLLTPGSASGEAHEASVRLCFTSVPKAELEDALEKLAPIFGR